MWKGVTDGHAWWTRNMATVERRTAKRTYHVESNRQETDAHAKGRWTELHYNEARGGLCPRWAQLFQAKRTVGETTEERGLYAPGSG